MDKKYIFGGIALALIIIAVAVLWGTEKSITSPLPVNQPAYVTPAVTEPTPLTYTKSVPKDAVLTEPKHEAPANPNPVSTAKARYFDLKATASGFSPSTITVNKGDTVYIDFSAVDGSYDFDIPYLGAYFSVVKQGSNRRLPFDVSVSGTFTFECRDYCPKGEIIKGSLVVLP
ncbi:cupredoxin domain-containing protein [Candidatus Jorgensenbacteria bacterium]|nr:cupredoxin domain-containing protein [Candidatus Jorgensenbacteria bacterium]